MKCARVMRRSLPKLTAARSCRTPNLRQKRRLTMTSKKLSQLLLILIACAAAVLAQTAKRPLKLDDLTRFRNVGDPQCAPEGKLVAYTVSTIDAKEDKGSSH